MSEIVLDHIAFLVKDLKEAVNDFQQILQVLAPDQCQEIVYDGNQVDGFDVRWATFVSDTRPVFQFIQSNLPKDQRLLQAKGECVHHIAFTSPDIEGTVKKLADREVPVTGITSSNDRPWLRWAFILPGKAHGTLIEIAAKYKVTDGKWAEDSE